MIFVGIDPGLDGALACIDEKGNFIEVIDMPTTRIGRRRKIDAPAMRWLLWNWLESDTYVFVEEQRPQKGQGVTSTFSTGRSMGILEGVLAGIQMPHEFISAVAWKRAMRIPPKSGKGGSMQMACRLWPTAPLHGPQGGAKDGRAEALLLAEWGRRQSVAQNSVGEAAQGCGEPFRAPTRGAVPGKAKNG